MQKIEHDSRFKGPCSEGIHSIGGQEKDATGPPPRVRVVGHHSQQGMEDNRSCTEGNGSNEGCQREQCGREHRIGLPLPRRPRRVHAHSQGQHTCSYCGQRTNQKQRPDGGFQRHKVKGYHEVKSALQYIASCF